MLGASVLPLWWCENNIMIRKVTKANVVKGNICLLNNVTRLQCSWNMNETQAGGQLTEEKIPWKRRVEP